MVKLIFPHQLFAQNPLFDLSGTIYLVEEWLFFQQFNFHQQKLAFHRATMKYYEDYLVLKGYTIIYIPTTDARSDVRQLLPFLHAEGVTEVAVVDPVDDWLHRRLQKGCTQLQLSLTVLDSPMFLNSRAQLGDFFSPDKSNFRQADFYKKERIARKILLDDSGNPVGGKWSYDVENRKKYPKNKPIPQVVYPQVGLYHQEAIAYVNEHFSQNIGTLSDAIVYPIGFQSGEEWLHQFLMHRLAEFGDYEDAIVQKESLLKHSLLTPLLNVGMITPSQIMGRTLVLAASDLIPLNSLEGFIRQIMGWREFIRGVYVAVGREERTKNFWGFTRKIPPSFYDGTTGIVPVDETIKKVLKTGYCHHIERLMVLGNFFLLCEFDPNEVYRWFMELFIDAYDWVMVPNVYGMSQFADGGMMSSKPYISGSNYIMKMSDYPKGDWQEIWDALFWNFLNNNRFYFLANQRLGMLVPLYDKWEESKKEAVQKTAAEFLEKLSQG